MISQKLLKQYDVKNINAYFDATIAEYEKGNENTVKAMFSNANALQKKAMLCRLVKYSHKKETICYFINLI